MAGACLLLVTGCSGGNPFSPPSPPVPNTELGGLDPHSAMPAEAVMEDVVERSQSLMETLGGEWFFNGGTEPFEAERVRSESNPRPCATVDESGDEVGGGQYSVVVVRAPMEGEPEATLTLVEEALTEAGYQPAESNGVDAGPKVVANGRSDRGAVLVTAQDSEVRIQLRSACSTDPSMQ